MEWSDLIRGLVYLPKLIMALVRPNKLKGLNGEWDYYCVLRGANMEFPEGGNAHGGVCIIHVVNKFEIKIKGIRKWTGTIDSNGRRTETPLIMPKEWDAVRASQVGPSEIYYQYRIQGEPVDGITFLNLKHSDESRKDAPRGKFHYVPNDDILNRPATPAQNLMDNKRVRLWGEMHGEVVLLNKRKHQD